MLTIPSRHILVQILARWEKLFTSEPVPKTSATSQSLFLAIYAVFILVINRRMAGGRGSTTCSYSDMAGCRKCCFEAPESIVKPEGDDRSTLVLSFAGDILMVIPPSGRASIQLTSLKTLSLCSAVLTAKSGSLDLH